MRIVHILVSWYTASKPWLTDCASKAANSWLLKIFRLHPGGTKQHVLPEMTPHSSAKKTQLWKVTQHREAKRTPAHLGGFCRRWQDASHSAGYSWGSAQIWRYHWDTQRTLLLQCNTAALHGLEENTVTTITSLETDVKPRHFEIGFKWLLQRWHERSRTNMSACKLHSGVAVHIGQ